MQRSMKQTNQNSSRQFAIWLAAGAVFGGATIAGATDITRSATATNLINATAWTGGVIPGSGDVAVWDTGSAGGNTLGGDTSWLGIRMAAGQTTATTISGANVLTLGASGIDMSAAVANLTMQPGATTTPASGITLGAAQTWNVGTGRLLQVGNGASGVTGAVGASITKTGLGTVYFNNGGNTFAGGIVLNAGAITFNTNSTVTVANQVASGPLGTGTLTINGGTLSTNTTSGRDIANDVIVGGDFTIGLAGTARVRSAGTWDLGGVTRNITLTAAGTGINNATEGFGFLGQGTSPNNKLFTLNNGTMRFVAGASSTATNPSTVSFAQGSGGVNFANNSGVTLGANVLAFEASSQTMGGTNSPKLTLEAGGVLLMGSATQAKNFTASSLSGSGTVGSFQTDGTALVSILTIDGSTGASNFSGAIQNVYNPFGLTSSAVTVNVAKTGASTQTFSGTNTYTGTTTVSAGMLVMGTTSAIAPASAVTVGNLATPAVYKLGFGPSGGVATIPLPTIGANGKFDVGTGQAVLTGTTVAAVQTLVNAGVAGSSQSIISSSADAAHGVGYGDIGAGGVSVRYTLLGDANLDGSVNFNDFLVLQNNFNAPGVFSQGDFNYDGTVNFNDFLVLQNNFGQSVTGAAVSFTKQQVAAMTAFASAVPEPTSLAVLGLAGAAALRRRRSI